MSRHMKSRDGYINQFYREVVIYSFIKNGISKEQVEKELQNNTLTRILLDKAAHGCLEYFSLIEYLKERKIDLEAKEF